MPELEKAIEMTDIECTRPVGEAFAVVEIKRGPTNYMDAPLIEAIADALHRLDEDRACRAVVLCSEGRHFCAGADFGGTSGAEPVSPDEGASRLYEAAARIVEAKKPVIAAVQGAAVGGGVGLALTADFRVASESTRFITNFSRLGIHQGFGLSVTLPEAVGLQKATELLYTGRAIDGSEAQAIGLCDRLVPEQELREAALEFAREIASSAPLAVQSIRETLRGNLAARIRAATIREQSEQRWLRDTADFVEGITAAGDRRPPEFTGS